MVIDIESKCILINYCLGAVPSTEKQERTKSQSKSKQRARVNNASDLFPSKTLYQEINEEGGVSSYHSQILIVVDGIKMN